MDRVMETLGDLVAHLVAEYDDAEGYKDKSYYLKDTHQAIYTIMIVPDDDHPSLKAPRLMLLARVITDLVVIDVDTTDRPLYQELLRAGIPREQIVLRYTGETLPAHLQSTPESE